MRYIRLLTSQQFQEHPVNLCFREVKKNNPQTLGEERISLGILLEVMLVLILNQV